MKWLPVQKQSPNHNKENSITPRPFLVLPRVSKTLMTGGTWPPPPRRPRSRRPSTATLERPILLDIELLHKLDMSLVRKEFLCITNLCKSPIVASLPCSPRVKKEKLGDKETSEDSPEDEENSARSRTNKLAKTVTKQMNIKKILKPKLPKPAKISRPNNSIQSETSTNGAIQSTTNSNTTAANTTSTALISQSAKRLPTPCTTCGRAEQPERFHSHPPPPPPAQKQKEVVKQKTSIIKNTVQKPLAIKFKSKKSVKETSEMKKIEKKVDKKEMGDTKKDVIISHSGPRTLTCYICGREFGTASLPLHEPKCLQKWERENAELPRHLQRKAPIKPTASSNEEWNKSAWEASQASLVPCSSCGRTFLPDRLIVHQRSCRPSPRQDLHKRTPFTVNRSIIQEMQPGPSPGPGSPGPPTVRCYICGRMFGTKSIGIHEPQCLKKWHMQNDLLPASQRLPPPSRSSVLPYPENISPQGRSSKSPVRSSVTSESTPPEVSNTPTSENKKPTLPCYVCGKEFAVTSIYNHEPICLKRWKAENEKLPPNQRKPEPQRGDIKFTPSGNVDFIGTFHRIWENHLNELVACRICGRTFFPDRIERHEQVCNNSPMKKPHKK